MSPAADPPEDSDFFRQIVDSAEEGVWFIDPDCRTRYINPRMAQMLGGSVERLMGMSMYELMDTAEKDTAERNVERRRQGVRETHEFRFRRLDGEELWAELSTSPLFDRQGNYLGALALVSDIGWRKAAEKQLSESERAYREVFERSQAVKLMIDPSTGDIVAANAAARQYYGYTEREFEQIKITDINILPAEEVRRKMSAAQEEDEPYFQFQHRLKNGEVHDVEVMVNPVIVAGRPLLYSIVHDIGRQTEAERRLKLLQFTVEQAHLCAIWINRDGTIRDTNRYAAELLKRPREAIVGLPIWEIDIQAPAEAWPARWDAVKRAGARTTRSEFVTSEGARIPVEIHASYLALDGEEFIIAYARDMVEQARGEGLLALQHDVLAGVAAGHSLSQTLDLLARRVEALTDGAHCTILLLEEGCLYNGASPSVPIEFVKSVNGLAIGPDVGTCGVAAYLDKTVETVDIVRDPNWLLAREVAELCGLRACWSTPIHARDGRVLGTFALYYEEPRSAGEFDRRVVESVTHLAAIAIEHHATESRIHALAFFDSLTGLPNRSLLIDRVELALARAEREGSAVALLFIDLDRFKTINDSLGHAVGDRFLCAISARLEEVVRDCDTVCRQGGDEFVVMLPDCDATGAALVAEKLIAAVTETVIIDEHRLSGSASVGISLYPDDAKNYDDLLKHADTAMYRAKEAGRNGYRFYRTKMNEETAERLEVENELRQALQRGDLMLYYQPQVRIGDGSIYGLEALLRWPHATWGMVSPARFIPVAEDSGLIDAIGAWVLDAACRQMSEWQAAGIDMPHIAINLSARQFRHEDVPAMVADALWKHGVEPARLTLEITESLMMHDESTLSALTALDEMGVTLAVDDFGTGYSSLGYLKRFPVKELKLDQTFVRDLGEDEDDCALASAVVRIGQSLRLTVVAEGVETAEQLAFLREEGCHVAQGYFFARPMPAADLINWLEAYQPVVGSVDA